MSTEPPTLSFPPFGCEVLMKLLPVCRQSLGQSSRRCILSGFRGFFFAVFRSLLGIFFPLFVQAEPPSDFGSSLVVAAFSQGSLEGWEEKKFAGNTSYRLTELDGQKVLCADSRQAASGLFRKLRVDLNATPYLNWSWRVDQGLPRLEETTREGDDYAARLYVVVDGGVFFWQTIAINYVWSSSQRVGSVWPSAFAGKNAMLTALRSAEDGRGTWYTEKRNLREDFKTVFGREILSIDAVALMSDTDNTKGEARACYGDISFTAD